MKKIIKKILNPLYCKLINNHLIGQIINSNRAMNNECIRLLLLMNNLSNLRNIISYINNNIKAIVTLEVCLEEAIQYAEKYRCENTTMPVFIVANRKKSSIDENWEKQNMLLKKYNVTILPQEEIKQIDIKNICLYTPRNTIGCLENSLQELLDYAKIGTENFSIIEHSIGSFYTPPLFSITRAREILHIYDSFADDISKETYLRAITYRATRNLAKLKISEYKQYFHPIVKVEEGDVICEGGPLDGNTTQMFIEKAGKSGRIFSFEPLQKFYKAVEERLKPFPNATIIHKGLWSDESEFYIADEGGATHLSLVKTEHTEMCATIDIDSYFNPKNYTPSIIKLDIEGAEPDALRGAMQTIKKNYPKLQISIYHGNDQMIDIPLWLLDNFPEYTFYCGHHECWVCETVLYAIKK